MSKMVRATNLKIMVYSLDALDLALEKVAALNQVAESDVTSNHMDVSIEVDLREIPEPNDGIPPLYKMRLALSEALQDAANGLRYVPEDSVNGKRYNLLEPGGNYTDRPEQDDTPHSKCSCKYAVSPGDKSIPRPPH